MLGVLPAVATDIVVAVSIASIVINPLASRLIATSRARRCVRLRRRAAVSERR